MNSNKKLKGLPWFKFYLNDYMNDTADLSQRERGAYDMCLWVYYRTEKPLPGDLTRLYAMVGSTTEDDKAHTRYALERFFKLEDGFYRHSKIDAVLQERNDRSLVAKDNIRARWDKAKEPTNREAARMFDEATAGHNPIFDKAEDIIDGLIMADVKPEQRAALAPCLRTIATARREQNFKALFEGVRGAISVAQVAGYTESQLMVARAWVAQHPVFDAAEAANITDEELNNLAEAVRFLQTKGPRADSRPGTIPAICFLDKDGKRVVQAEPPNAEQLRHIVAQIRAGIPEALGFGFLTPKGDA